MHPKPTANKLMKLLILPTLLTAALIGGCGGGGGDEPSPSTALASVRSTALADNPPPNGFDFALTRTVAGLRSNELVSDAARFADPIHTYVSIWIQGASQQRLQLAFVTLAVLQALDAHGGLVVQLPVGLSRMYFEVYDARGATTALSGEITR